MTEKNQELYWNWRPNISYMIYDHTKKGHPARRQYLAEAEVEADLDGLV